MPTSYHAIDLSGLSNRSILIVDDNYSIHRDYQAVLQPDQRDENEDTLDELEQLLHGESVPTPTPPRQRNFELQSTFQGEDAHELVGRHLKKGVRYPLAFVDMRMPPGWDGLETIQRIRTVDGAMQFVIVTAYSDHTEQDIEQALGNCPPVQIVYKPFNPTELYELAYQFVSDWNANQSR